MTTTKPGEIDIPRKKYVRKITARSFNLAPGDLELLAWCQGFLGCSQAEVVRSAIRAYATSLEAISRTRT